MRSNLQMSLNNLTDRLQLFSVIKTTLSFIYTWFPSAPIFMTMAGKVARPDSMQMSPHIENFPQKEKNTFLSRRRRREKGTRNRAKVSLANYLNSGHQTSFPFINRLADVELFWIETISQRERDSELFRDCVDSPQPWEDIVSIEISQLFGLALSKWRKTNVLKIIQGPSLEIRRNGTSIQEKDFFLRQLLKEKIITQFFFKKGTNKKPSRWTGTDYVFYPQRWGERPLVPSYLYFFPLEECWPASEENAKEKTRAVH